jgi:hypothetical protein
MKSLMTQIQPHTLVPKDNTVPSVDPPAQKAGNVPYREMNESKTRFSPQNSDRFALLLFLHLLCMLVFIVPLALPLPSDTPKASKSATLITCAGGLTIGAIVLHVMSDFFRKGDKYAILLAQARQNICSKHLMINTVVGMDRLGYFLQFVALVLTNVSMCLSPSRLVGNAVMYGFASFVVIITGVLCVQEVRKD